MAARNKDDDRVRTLLIFLLCLYLTGRVLQLYAGKIPDLIVVVFHVVPSAVFAVLHGERIYRWRGILIFVASCIGVGSVAEILSLRTGFPFGHYQFTGLMGPKVFGLPILLALAYLGMGYLAWVLAVLILRCESGPLSGHYLVLAPVLASFVMVAWDLAMDPVWAYVDRAWIWQSGGAFYGVPISNFAGWYLTAYVSYQLFALFLKRGWTPPAEFRLTGQPKSIIAKRPYWRLAVLFYAASAAGNFLVVAPASMPGMIADPSGRQWRVSDILLASRLISLFVMLPFCLAAWSAASAADSSQQFTRSYSSS